MYNTAQYAGSRLNETIVRTASQHPVVVYNVFYNDVNEIVVSYFDLIKQVEEIASLKSLILKPIPLGYVNVGGSCCYLSRKPMRHDWRQGLRDKSVKKIGFPIKLKEQAKSLYELAINRYPTFETSIENLTKSDEVYSIAFSRQFCIKKYDGEYLLRYKETNVGRVNVLDKTVTLNPSKIYLREKLGEIIDDQYIN